MGAVGEGTSFRCMLKLDKENYFLSACCLRAWSSVEGWKGLDSVLIKWILCKIEGWMWDEEEVPIIRS